MTPQNFDEANQVFSPPKDLDESQCISIPAFVGEVKSGSVDGVPLVVVAWRPTSEELDRLNAGCAIFLTMIGGLAPHYLSTTFEEATHPA